MGARLMGYAVAFGGLALLTGGAFPEFMPALTDQPVAWLVVGGIILGVGEVFAEAAEGNKPRKDYCPKWMCRTPGPGDDAFHRFGPMGK